MAEQCYTAIYRVKDIGEEEAFAIHAPNFEAAQVRARQVMLLQCPACNKNHGDSMELVVVYNLPYQLYRALGEQKTW